MSKHDNQRMPHMRSRLLRPEAPKGPTRTLAEFANDVGVSPADVRMAYARAVKAGETVPEPVIKTEKHRRLPSQGYFLRSELVAWWRGVSASGATQ